MEFFLYHLKKLWKEATKDIESGDFRLTADLSEDLKE